MALTEVTGFKARYLVKRKKGMSFDDFKSHQLNVHVPLALDLPGVRDYAISLFEPIDGVDQAFDAIAEITFDSSEAHDAALASERGAKALADLPNYLHEPENNTVLLSQPGSTFKREAA